MRMTLNLQMGNIKRRQDPKTCETVTNLLYIAIIRIKYRYLPTIRNLKYISRGKDTSASCVFFYLG